MKSKCDCCGRLFPSIELQEIEHEIIEENFEDEIEITTLKLFGSRINDTPRNDSDLDIYFEYIGDVREDDVFNAVMETPVEVSGITMYLFPVQIGE